MKRTKLLLLAILLSVPLVFSQEPTYERPKVDVWVTWPRRSRRREKNVNPHISPSGHYSANTIGVIGVAASPGD